MGIDWVAFASSDWGCGPSLCAEYWRDCYRVGRTFDLSRVGAKSPTRER